MKTLSLNELQEELESMGVTVCGTAAEFYGDETTETDNDGLWVSAEESYCKDTEWPLFDYYDMSDSYIFGVYKPVSDKLKNAGWYAEANDPGTYMIWKV